jgi:hypothetical protein
MGWGVVLGFLLGVTLCRAGGAGIIDWATVGDAGNTADTAGAPNPAGAVGYEFRI